MTDEARVREARRLRSARVVQRRTAVSVAQSLCISAQYFHDLEHGRRHAPGDLYARWCGLLGVENDRPEAEVVRLRACLGTLVAVAEELSARDAGPHWEALCRALAGARAVLAGKEGR